MKLASALLPLAPLLLAGGCATNVTHPTRNSAQMRADVATCSDRAHARFQLDPVAALYNAYDCLEAMGYQRHRSGFEAFVEENFAGRRRPAQSGVRVCQVPCRNGLSGER